MKNLLLLSLVLALALAGCECPPKVTNLPKIHQVDAASVKIPKINLVLENSASMEPYYKSSQFQENVSNLIPNLQEISDKQNFLYSDQAATFATFATNPGDAITKIKTGFQTGGNSPLDQIIINLINKSIQDRSVSILVTDLIIDDPNLDGPNELNTLKARIKAKFLDASKNQLGSIIYRFETKLSGKYFTSKQALTYDIDQSRPYFFWVIGPTELVTALGLNLEQKLDSTIKYDAVYAGIKPNFGSPYLFPYSGAKGCSPKTTYSKDSSSIEKYFVQQKQDSVEFCFGINLSELPKVLQKDSSDMQNIIKPSVKIAQVELHYFRQEKFLKQKFINSNEIPIVNGLTHFYLVKVKEIDESSSYAIDLLLQVNSAHKFNEFSIDDDTEKENLGNKTFGLKQFVNGMLEAFDESKSQKIATIQIN